MLLHYCIWLNKEKYSSDASWIIFFFPEDETDVLSPAYRWAWRLILEKERRRGNVVVNRRERVLRSRWLWGHLKQLRGRAEGNCALCPTVTHQSLVAIRSPFISTPVGRERPLCTVNINCCIWPPLRATKCKSCSLESLSWWSRPALRHSSDILWVCSVTAANPSMTNVAHKNVSYKKGGFIAGGLFIPDASPTSPLDLMRRCLVLSCDLTSGSCCVGGRGRSVWSKSCRKMRRVFDSMLSWMLYWCWCRWSQCHQGISCGWQGI